MGAAFVTHWRRPLGLGHAVVELGRPDNGTGFRGSDRLTMNAITHLKPWLVAQLPPLLLVEGDRFANGSFLEWSRAWGWRPWVFYLDLPPHTAEARRNARFSEKGAAWHFKTRPTTGLPDPTWVQGRVTKARNLAQEWNATVLDATRSPEELAADILEACCPVASALLADC